MKRTTLLLLFFITFSIFVGARTYYSLVSAFPNGGVVLSNGDYSEISVSDSEISWQFDNFPTVRAVFKKIDSHGNRVYRSSRNNFGQYSIVTTTPDFKNMIIKVMWGNDWASTRWLTSSRAVQSAFIAQNQHLNSAGVDFRALYDQSHSSNNSSRSHNHNNTSCSNCNGTGVDPSPNTGGSAVGWVAYYNRPKSKCPYCNRYSSHFHDKCARCNTPSR